HPVFKPGAAVSRMLARAPGVRHPRASDGAFRDFAVQLHELGLVPYDMSDEQPDAPAFTSLDHLCGVLERQRDRLLADDMFPGLRRLYGERLVRVAGCRDADRIAARMPEHLRIR